jgi:hypothetical protein
MATTTWRKKKRSGKLNLKNQPNETSWMVDNLVCPGGSL